MTTTSPTERPAGSAGAATRRSEPAGYAGAIDPVVRATVRKPTSPRITGTTKTTNAPVAITRTAQPIVRSAAPSASGETPRSGGASRPSRRRSPASSSRTIAGMSAATTTGDGPGRLARSRRAWTDTSSETEAGRAITSITSCSNTTSAGGDRERRGDRGRSDGRHGRHCAGRWDASSTAGEEPTVGSSGSGAGRAKGGADMGGFVANLGPRPGIRPSPGGRGSLSCRP